MKRISTGFLVATLLALGVTAQAQVPRDNVFWARTAPGPIVLDGVLDEPVWAKAESKVLRYGENSGIPGGGWKLESGAFIPTDPVEATLRLLVVGNELYLGAEVTDSSVGGAAEFNRFDGFLMAIKDHADPGTVAKPPSEYFYSWWYAETVDPQPSGQSPNFIGRWAPWPPGTARTPEDIANWDAVTVVHGLSNDDSVVDQGYTVEMRFNLTPMGYDVTQPGGDIVEWNISIYDCDWFWPFEPLSFGTQRTWWQSPWGNAAWYDELRVFARPDVTVDTPVVPFVEPEVVIPEITTPPTIDGALTEPMWSNASTYDFDIRWDDQTLRDSYPQVGPYRSGQFQPEVEGGTAFVIDGGDATVKVAYSNTTLYLGFDARDLVITNHPEFDRWDGFVVSINERGTLGPDNQLLGRRISFQVDADGTALAQDYLTTLVTAGDAEVAISLNPGSVVDNTGGVDNGYTAELAIDLTALGYPANLGDRVLFIGVIHLDADSFVPASDSYGTRTWWYREFEGDCCPAWAHLKPNAVAVVPSLEPGSRTSFVRSYPNPSSRPSILYSLRMRGRLELSLFDVRGRLIEQRELGVQEPGEREVVLQWGDRSAGLYLYQLRVHDPTTGRLLEIMNGKTALVK